MSRKPRKKGAPKGEPRRRRTAEEARRVILDAAEKRLAEGGPEAVRLQDIALDVGISHPAILHHFGSRNGLTEALAQRSIETLDRDLLRALESARENADVAAAIEQVFETLGDSGHARLLAWRALESREHIPESSEQMMLRHVTDALHRLRLEHATERGIPEPSFEDTFFVVRLGATALIGDGVTGKIIDLAVDPQLREDLPRRFRAWLVRVLAQHIGYEFEDGGG